MNNETMATLRRLNMSAVREHSLKCSREKRAGKFTRVSDRFLDGVQADVEALVRRINSEVPIDPRELVETNETFTTGALMERAQHALNAAVARIIQRRVQRHPTVGMTLID